MIDGTVNLACHSLTLMERTVNQILILLRFRQGITQSVGQLTSCVI